MTVTSISMQKYFDSINKQVESAYSVAGKARALGYDPEDKVDIPLAKNMAERVHGLISVVVPQLDKESLIAAIVELEAQYGALDWRVGFRIAEEVTKEKFCKFSSKKESIEAGIRTGFAYLTCGIVSAPLEGFIELKIKKRNDGKEYFAVYYAGPIRGAGGTAAATSVILADYLRVKLGYAPYDPSDKEIMRYLTEVYDYHERAVNLQYLPSLEELKFLVMNIPVEITGDPTEQIEVSNYKDLPRMETNRIRGGMCLVLAEGISQKANKLWKRVGVWGEEFSLDWKFLEQFIALQKRIKSKSKVIDTSQKTKLSPNLTYITDLVAGRPILTHPLAKGGFRLRYGKTRISGFSAAGIHPITMRILNNYIATGTQLKMERPGKAAAITPCDSIEAQIVRLKNGSVIYLDSEQKYRQYKDEIEKILFLGDILFSYGDFSENNHFLVPAGYNEEWWQQHLQEAILKKFNEINIPNLSVMLNIPEDELTILLTKTSHPTLTFTLAYKLSETFNIPLHPKYTFHWKLVSLEDLFQLVILLGTHITTIERDDLGEILKIIIKKHPHLKKVLEEIGVPHLFVNYEFIVLERHHSAAFMLQLGNLDKTIHPIIAQVIESNKSQQAQGSGTGTAITLTSPTSLTSSTSNNLATNLPNPLAHLQIKNTALEAIQKISLLPIKDKSGTFIGARMGRPEKAKQRKLTGSPQALFPVGEEGGRLRSFLQAIKGGKIRSLFSLYRCLTCSKETIYKVCEVCDSKTQKMYYCKLCGLTAEKNCPKHGPCSTYTMWEIDASHYFNHALDKIQDKIFPELIKGVKGTSNKDHIPENLIKGILSAKHNIYVNKDGTTRFDMSELPLTHFKPGEITVSVEKLKSLGYTHDIFGEELKDDSQILEIKPQDIIVPAATEALDDQADIVLLNVGNFIDELLVKFYKLEPFYNFKSREDLVGQIVIAIAPHISAGVIGRIIGFSETQGFLAHPLFHAAMRRDADGDEAGVMLLMDGLLNFSRSFLPDKRGSKTMDSPLVLTATIIPSEVDEQALGVDVVTKYPLEFYDAATEYKMPSEIKIEQIRHRLNTEQQYENIRYTHDVSSINLGVKCSAYKSLPSMEEKLAGQMAIAKKIAAVDEHDVARLVIEKHFLKDIKGNLRKFSTQSFRCSSCNEKYRRPPLVGICLKCSGKIIFTVSEGSVVKYLDYSIALSKDYNVPEYLRQTIELVKRAIEGNFAKEKEKQSGLLKWAVSS